MTAYATLEDLVALFETEPKAARQPRFESLLEEASQELRDELGGLDFGRTPSAGTAAWLVDGAGTPLLHLHHGIVTLTNVEISLDRGATFVTLATSDYRLQWDAFTSDEPPTGEPHFHLRMLPYATYSTFPEGIGTVRLTGARGWLVIPRALVEGTAQRARQLAFGDANYEGSVPAQDEFGRPTISLRWPDVTYKFIQREKHRFMACEM